MCQTARLEKPNRDWLSHALTLGLVLLLTGCIPAQTPAILESTRGAGVTIADDVVMTRTFRVRVPSGWRTILSAADQRPSITTAAPENCAVIIITSTAQMTPALAANCGAAQFVSRAVLLSSGSIRVIGVSSRGGWEDFVPVFEQVTASIQAP